MPDEPTLGEVARLVGDLRQDVRDDIANLSSRLDAFVLREVYAERNVALDLRLTRMEREQETNRTNVRAAIYAALGSVIASVSAGVILAVVIKG